MRNALSPPQKEMISIRIDNYIFLQSNYFKSKYFGIQREEKMTKLRQEEPFWWKKGKKAKTKN